MTEDKSALKTVYSIGHGSRGSSEFVAQLTSVGAECLVDVRAYPTSKRHPQFTRLAIEPALRGAGIRYIWEGEALGGMRRPQERSSHIALRDPTLRGYADHTASDAFRQGIERLMALACEQTIVVMCAEKDPLHCHRSFIADALAARGVRVLHLHDEGDVRNHVMRPEARQVHGADIVYDSGVQAGLTF